IALPIAAGVFEPVIGLVLRPEIAALSMSGSSFIVAVNAVMLKRLKLPAPPIDQDAARRTDTVDAHGATVEPQRQPKRLGALRVLLHLARRDRDPGIPVRGRRVHPGRRREQRGGDGAATRRRYPRLAPGVRAGGAHRRRAGPARADTRRVAPA